MTPISRPRDPMDGGITLDDWNEARVFCVHGQHTDPPDPTGRPLHGGEDIPSRGPARRGPVNLRIGRETPALGHAIVRQNSERVGAGHLKDGRDLPMARVDIDLRDARPTPEARGLPGTGP